MKPLKRAYTFVGECRSATAIRKGWTWKDGRLAAKPLFEALEVMGIDPFAQRFINLWTDSSPPTIPWQRVEGIKRDSETMVIVALGQRVSSELTARGIDHVALVHPAARGKIRKRSRYIKHVADKLGKGMRVSCGEHRALASTASVYVFEIETKSGHRRVYPPGIGTHDEAACTPHETLAVWFKRLGITRVVSVFDNPKTDESCIADGTYTTAQYLKWWKQAEEQE